MAKGESISWLCLRSRQDKFSRDYGLRDQIQRAAGSVMHNIA